MVRSSALQWVRGVSCAAQVSIITAVLNVQYAVAEEWVDFENTSDVTK